MCPACAVSAAVVIGGVISTGGLTALIAKMLRRRKVQQSESKKES